MTVYALAPDAHLARFVGTAPSVRGYRVGGTRIVPISGLLGPAEYNRIEAELAEAMNDDATRNVVLHLDTPGGSTQGAYAAADAVHAASQVKPTLAFLDEAALSAGALLASQANHVVLPEAGQLGSIGIRGLHLEASRMLDQAGITPTEFHRGAHKLDGSAFRPLTEQASREFDALMGEHYTLLVDRVARGRKLTSEAVRAQEARTFTGRHAVRAGLADAVASPHEVARGIQQAALAA